MLSKVFPSAGLASVCAGILYLISFMPLVLIFSLEAIMDNSFKLLVVTHLYYVSLFPAT